MLAIYWAGVIFITMICVLWKPETFEEEASRANLPVWSVQLASAFLIAVWPATIGAAIAVRLWRCHVKDS